MPSAATRLGHEQAHLRTDEHITVHDAGASTVSGTYRSEAQFRRLAVVTLSERFATCAWPGVDFAFRIGSIGIRIVCRAFVVDIRFRTYDVVLLVWLQQPVQYTV